MPVGRPTKYNPKFINSVNEYLEENQDSYIEETTRAGLTVKLPTIEGFAAFIGVNKTSLYEWEAKNPMFSNALDKIRQAQHQRLINKGLSGEYNSTIAKLVLSSNHNYAEKTKADIKADVEVSGVEISVRKK